MTAPGPLTRSRLAVMSATVLALTTWAGTAGATTEPPDEGACDICAAAAAGPVKIVHLTDLPGESPTAVDDFWNGSSLAAAEINEQCGTEVVQLERVGSPIQPDAFEPKLLEAQEMEPTALIGGPSSSLLALNSVVDEGGIPMIWPVGTAAGLTDGENASEWSWMARAVNDRQGE